MISAINCNTGNCELSWFPHFCLREGMMHWKEADMGSYSWRESPFALLKLSTGTGAEKN